MALSPPRVVVSEMPVRGPERVRASLVQFDAAKPLRIVTLAVGYGVDARSAREAMIADAIDEYEGLFAERARLVRELGAFHDKIQAMRDALSGLEAPV